MAKPIVKTPAAKPAPAKPRRHVDAMAFLASMESVAIAEDKNVSVDAPLQKDNKDDLTASVVPNKEVSADDKNVKTIQPGPANGGGDGSLATQDVGKVKVHQSTDQANADEVDSVTNKTADAVKAGEKDLTTGVVSSEDNIEANEAEHISPKEADDAVMNVEQAVADLDATGITAGSDAALQRAEQVGNDLENIEKVEMALEQYQGLLRGLKAKGKTPSRELAQAITIALESHDRVFFRPVVASLEDFGRPDTHRVAALGLEASIGGKLKELGAAAGNAVMRLLEMIMDAWNHFRRDTPKLVTELSEIASKLKTTDLDAGKSVPVKAAARLMINGNFIGDSVEVVRNVEKTSRELLVEWPQALIKLASSIEGNRKQVAVSNEDTSTPDGIEAAAQTALEATFSQFKQVDSNDAPSSLSNYAIVTRSPILPGNKAMFIGIQDGDNASINVAANKYFMKFAFESTGDRDGGSDGEVSMPSTERAIAAVNAVKDIVGNLIGKDTSMAQLKGLAKTLQTDAGTQAGDVVRGAVSAALMQHRLFMGYLVSLVKAYIAFYQQILAGNGSKEVAIRENGATAKTDGKTADRTKEADDESVVSTQ